MTTKTFIQRLALVMVATVVTMAIVITMFNYSQGTACYHPYQGSRATDGWTSPHIHDRSVQRLGACEHD